jgi:hypothetical protein
MSALTQALQDISLWMGNSTYTHAEWIRRSNQRRAGIEREMIELYSEEYKFQFSEEVYELYQWCDGSIVLGDYANPVSLAPLDWALSELPRLAIFVGDGMYYAVDEASGDLKTSPIYCYDAGHKMGNYAPSITSLMQALAECVRLYDGISACYMSHDKSLLLSHSIQGMDMWQIRKNLLDPICDRYGLIGASNQGGCLWR